MDFKYLTMEDLSINSSEPSEIKWVSDYGEHGTMVRRIDCTFEIAFFTWQYVHYNELSETEKKDFGPLPDGFYDYWTGRYPNLMVHLEEAVSSMSKGQSSDKFPVSQPPPPFVHGKFELIKPEQNTRHS